MNRTTFCEMTVARAIWNFHSGLRSAGGPGVAGGPGCDALDGRRPGGRRPLACSQSDCRPEDSRAHYYVTVAGPRQSGRGPSLGSQPYVHLYKVGDLFNQFRPACI